MFPESHYQPKPRECIGSVCAMWVDGSGRGVICTVGGLAVPVGRCHENPEAEYVADPAAISRLPREVAP